MFTKIRRAIISVTDKSGLVDFAKGLLEFGVDIISTGGTAKSLKAEGIRIMDISQYTGFPEIMDGRVKTLHPKVHGGILAIRDNPEHVDKMKELNISPIDMVVVNLYQFEQTVSKPNIKFEDAIENIDIGGPTLLRAAAKNFKYVTVVCDPNDYNNVLDEMKKNNGATSILLRFNLAKKVFMLTSKYDNSIYMYLDNIRGMPFAS